MERIEGDQRISLRDKIFREIVANMLIHREYTNAYPSTFIIYKHKVETRNANRPHLYGQLLPETFVPFPKNPHIAQIFTQMGRSEELGTGLRNVYKYSKAYSGSEDILFNEEDVFTVDVPLDNETESNRDVVENVVENELKIIGFLRENNALSAKFIANKMNVTERTIQRYLKILANKSIIRRIGPPKGGRWEINQDNV